MKYILIMTMFILFGNSLSIKPIKKPFPKITYTKIYDISYRAPIYIRKKEPYTFSLIKKTNKCINYYINYYIDEIYGMASFSLSYNFITPLNITINN